MKSAWGVALQLVGAVAGVGALMTFVGGAIVWIQFSELKLPSDQAVTLLPKQLLLIVGAHEMAIPVGVALLVALVLIILNVTGASDTAKRITLIVLAALATLATGLVVSGFEFDLIAATLVALALGWAALLAVSLAVEDTWVLPWVAFMVFVLWGGVVSIVRTVDKPEMEPVAVLLDGAPSGVAGFFIGQTTDRVYLAPLPGTGDPGDPFADARVDRIMAIDRENVLQLALREPEGTGPEHGGRHLAQTLLEDLRVLVAGAPSPARQTITTKDPVTAFAPLVHLHSDEDLWPMSAEKFLANSWLVWAHDDGCDDWVPAGNHLPRPAVDADAKGAFDVARLRGPNAYRHREANNRCVEDRAGEAIPADARTRPGDKQGRPAGLDVNEGFYLDLDDRRRKGTRRVREEGPQSIFEKVPVYFEQQDARADGKAGLRITYWFFYGLSRPPGGRAVTKYLVHEGDWERISVLLHMGDVEGRYVPVSVRYHTHDENRDVPWVAVKRVGTAGADVATHPVAFSAVGSHASYWRAGEYESVFRVRGRPRLTVFDEAIACPDCPEWRTWESLRDAKVQQWYGFGGAWGSVTGGGGFNGPLGPSRYKSGTDSPLETVRQAETPVTGRPPDEDGPVAGD